MNQLVNTFADAPDQRDRKSGVKRKKSGVLLRGAIGTIVAFDRLAWEVVSNHVLDLDANVPESP